MRISPRILCLALLASTPALAEEAVDGIPQLLQLNRASQQELRTLQDAAGPVGAVKPAPQSLQTEQLKRTQDTEQQLLQESQRRQVLMQNQGARIDPADGTPYRLQVIDRQSRFRLQQQNQLNRFRTQQRTLSR